MEEHFIVDKNSGEVKQVEGNDKDWKVIRKLRTYLKGLSDEEFTNMDKDEKQQVLDLQRAERLFTYKYDFYAFVIEVLKAEEKGEPPCKLSKVHKNLCRFMRRTKNLNKNAFIQVPRYHLKTQICTIYYRAWKCVTDPEMCSLIVSGTMELSKSTSRSIKQELQNNNYLRDLYSDVLPDWVFNDRKNKWSETQFNVARKNNYAQCSIEAVGVEATVTGKHFGEISMDDIVTPENSTTGEQCQKVIQAYKYFCSIVNPKRGRFIVVGTPYKDSDLYTFIKETDAIKSFEVFIQPVYDNQGNPIWPEMYDHEKIKEIEQVQGSYTFATQYLLDPVPEDQMEIKKEWIKVYHALPRDVNGNEVYTNNKIIVDPITFKPTTSSSKDRGVILTVGQDKANNIYVLDYVLHNRAKEATMFESIFEQQEKYNANDVGWESVAYQIQGKHNLEEERVRSGRSFRVIELRTKQVKKEVRIRRLIPYFERGQIYIKPWMRELLHEIYRFPHGDTVDILDALAYIIEMFPVRQSWSGHRRFQSDAKKRPYYV